jgi:hypothetical protein
LPLSVWYGCGLADAADPHHCAIDFRAAAADMFGRLLCDHFKGDVPRAPLLWENRRRRR